MVDWQTIDTVLLDLDGTLLDLHYDNYFWFTHLPMRYAEANNIPLTEAVEYLEKKIRQYEGTLQWYCLDHWSEIVNLDLSILKQEIKHKIRVRPNVERFLERLRAIQKKVVLITNAHPKGLQIKLDVTKIDRFLDLVVSSHQFNAPKEDQEFWHQLQRFENFDADRCAFIDDNLQVLRSAELYGVKHLFYIAQPDSQKEGRETDEFTCVFDFDEIMP